MAQRRLYPVTQHLCQAYSMTQSRPFSRKMRRGPWDENSLAARIDIELQAILQHLGPEAPEASAAINPRVNSDVLIRFVTPTAVYSLAGDFAVRLQRLPDGHEDVSYWRDGVQI